MNPLQNMKMDKRVYALCEDVCRIILIVNNIGIAIARNIQNMVKFRFIFEY